MSCKASGVRATIAIALGAALTLGAASGKAAEWAPTHNIEIVVPFAAGGGNDVPARIVQKIMTEKRIIDVPSIVVNRPGGGGAVGLNYLNQHAGDGHYLSIISTSTLTSYIIGNGTLNYTDLTPIIPVVTEYIAFAVYPESPIKSFSDLVRRMKADPTGTTFAVGGGLGNPNHVAMAAALKAGGVDVTKMKAVAFGGGKEAMTAVMGGHVDVLAAAASVLAGQIKGGKLRVLAVAAPHRLSRTLATIPTLKEQSVDVVFGFSRYIVGPRSLTDRQIDYWDRVFAKVVKTPEWAAAVAQHNWESEYATSAATRKDLDAQYKSLEAILTDLGMAKNRAGKQ